MTVSHLLLCIQTPTPCPPTLLPFSYTTATVLTAYLNAIRQALRGFHSLWKAIIADCPIVSVDQVSLSISEATSLCVSWISFIPLAPSIPLEEPASAVLPMVCLLFLCFSRIITLDRQACSQTCCQLHTQPFLSSAIAPFFFLIPFTAKLPSNKRFVYMSVFLHHLIFPTRHRTDLLPRLWVATSPFSHC